MRRLSLWILALLLSVTVFSAGTPALTEPRPSQGPLADRPEPLLRTVSLPAVADVMIAEDECHTNFNGFHLATEYWFENGVFGIQYARGFLVRFDLTGLPPGATIDNAQLRVNWHSCPATVDSSASVVAYFVKGAWSESTVTWNTQPWTESIGLASQISRWDPDPANWDIGSFARAWQSDPASNRGVYVVGPWSGDYAFRFHSRYGFIKAVLNNISNLIGTGYTTTTSFLGNKR